MDIFFHISSGWVNLLLCSENQLPSFKCKCNDTHAYLGRDGKRKGEKDEGRKGER